MITGEGFQTWLGLKEEFQSLDENEIDELQNELFLRHIRYLFDKSPYYANLFKTRGISFQDVQSLKKLPALPLTSKEDLSARNNSFQAVSDREIVDVCLTSSTTGGAPTTLNQTFQDLSRLAYNEEGAFRISGMTENDTAVICASLERCFMAGMAYFVGGVSLGTKMVRAGSGSALQTWELIKNTGANILIGVPSLFIKIAEEAIEAGYSPASLKIKKLIAIGEPVRDEFLSIIPAAAKAEQLWNASIFSTYASTELATTFAECEARCGGHIRPEMIITEILDNNGLPVPAGEKGEVVVTPLGVTGMPLLRYKTGDISFLINEPCPCGRKTIRLGPILGRKNQMLKYKGTTIFPNALLNAVEGTEGIGTGFVEANLGSDGMDRVTLYISINKPELTENRIKDILRAKIRVVPEIIVWPEEKINEKIYVPGKRKRIQFYDLRNK